MINKSGGQGCFLTMIFQLRSALTASNTYTRPLILLSFEILEAQSILASKTQKSRHTSKRKVSSTLKIRIHIPWLVEKADLSPWEASSLNNQGPCLLNLEKGQATGDGAQASKGEPDVRMG